MLHSWMGDLGQLQWRFPSAEEAKQFNDDARIEARRLANIRIDENKAQASFNERAFMRRINRELRR
jgi:hypothetical protein